MRLELAAVAAVVPLSPPDPELDGGLRLVERLSMARPSELGAAVEEPPWGLQAQARPWEPQEVVWGQL